MEKKENKTKASQIAAVKNYDNKNGKVTIACKITESLKKDIELRAETKGFKSINAYLLDLINNDLSLQEGSDE